MPNRPLSPMRDSQQFMAEIIGDESLGGQRMQAGAILDLMDGLAGRVAAAHAGSSVVTLSFDRVDLIHPLYHSDLVRLEGRVLNVGRSSISVGVDVFREDFTTRQFQPIQHSLVTMVAVDENRRPNPNIPGLALQTEQEKALHQQALAQKSLTRQWLEMLADVAQRHPLEVPQVEEDLNRDKPRKLSPAETEVRVKRQFMPRNNNALGTIFGGDILLWLDRVATHTARRFTGNPYSVTLAMNRIFFKQPIFITDLVEMTARVVYVRHYTLEVEITVSVQRASGEVLPSHSGYFTVLNLDGQGVKAPVPMGLKLDNADQDSLGHYLQARERHRFWREHQQG